MKQSQYRKSRRLKPGRKKKGTWGGAREGAGRPRIGRGKVGHRARPPLASRHPVQVTMRLVEGVPSLREPAAFDAVRTALRGAMGRDGFRFVHYSVMSDHLHLLLEAKDASAMSNGIRSFQVRMVNGVNKLWKRKGRLFSDRYDSRVLKEPLEVRGALRFVLLDARKHAAKAGEPVAPGWLDPFSSGGCFDGWGDGVVEPAPPDSYDVTSPHTWLLQTGWRQHGLLALDEVPGAG